jgi:hypothetical protein
MSSVPVKNKNFVKRFIETCGTFRPKEIAELLNISNTAAKNYLQGRLPEPKILITISQKTPYSIHWLLTGEGDKFASQSVRTELNLMLDNLTAIAPADFLLEFGKFLEFYNSIKRYNSSNSPKTVTLTPDKVREEKMTEEDSADLFIGPS